MARYATGTATEIQPRRDSNTVLTSTSQQVPGIHSGMVLQQIRILHDILVLYIACHFPPANQEKQTAGYNYNSTSTHACRLRLRLTAETISAAYFPCRRQHVAWAGDIKVLVTDQFVFQIRG